jgi:hypothetical protein
MRRSIVILALVAIATSLACSLIYRPSDYFDPAGQLTTIASGTEGANNIVLTSSLVVYSTDTGIYAVSKTGGDPQTITTFGSTDLVAIAGDNENLVAWCGAMGVQAWHPGGAIQILDTATDCASVDAFAGKVAAAVTSDVGGVPTYQLYVFDGQDQDQLSVDLDASSAFPSDASEPADRVVLTKDDLYYTVTSVIGRRPQPGETLPRGDPYCGLGLGGQQPESFQVIEQSDGGPFILFRGKQGFRFETSNRCCRESAPDGSPDVCPADGLNVGNSYQAIVAHSPYIYYLPANQLLRASMSDMADASTLIRGGLTDVRGSLAIDGSYAYLGSGNDIFRIALPP